MPLEELRKFFPGKLNYMEGAERLSRVQVETIGKWLQENSGFRECLVEGQAEKRELVSRYLQQEIDVLDDRYGFVEFHTEI